MVRWNTVHSWLFQKPGRAQTHRSENDLAGGVCRSLTESTAEGRGEGKSGRQQTLKRGTQARRNGSPGDTVDELWLELGPLEF